MMKKNWLILFKFDNNKSFFKELLWSGNVLYLTSGLFSTWGSTEKIEFNNEFELNTAIKAKTRDFEQQGFEIVREWQFDPLTFDYDLLTREIENSLLESIKLAYKKEPNINGFAIGTDDSAMTIFPIYSKFDSFQEIDDDDLFLISSWEYWDYDFGTFEIPYRLILNASKSELYYNYNDLFDEFYEHFSDACVKAIKGIQAKLNLDKNNSIFLVSSTESLITKERFSELNCNQLSNRYLNYYEE